VIAVIFKTMSKFCSSRVLLLLFFPLILISCGGSNSSQSNSLDNSSENSFESTSSTAPQKTCAQGGVCAVEDVGPGGGIVFYDAGRQEPWGRYLEFACSGWQKDCDGSPDPELEYGCGDAYPELEESVGLGEANSKALVEKCGIDSAARAPLEYLSRSGVDDWFLPSRWELGELYEYLERRMFPVEAGFTNGPHDYWSSSSRTEEGSIFYDFQFGLASITFGPRPDSQPGRYTSDRVEYLSARIRPIRSF
jgi:hypothetical protein